MAHAILNHPALAAHPRRSLALILLWLVSVAGMAVAGLPRLGTARVVAAGAGLLFILVLIRHLLLSPPHAAELPNLVPQHLPHLGFWGRLGAVVLALLGVFAIGLLVSPGVSLLVASAIVGTGIVIVWRCRLCRGVVLVGLVAGGAVAVGIRVLEGGDLAWAMHHALALPPAVVAGILLCEHSGLAGVRLLSGRIRLSLGGGAWGCVLALPAAVLNLMGNLHAADSWVQHPWQLLAALNPAIAEEVWARLLLTTLIYALLRPVANQRPRWALAAAVLLGAGTHALAHSGINVIGLVIGALLYGVPCGLLFVKRDLEHAVGYHFGIDLVRYGAALVG